MLRNSERQVGQKVAKKNRNVGRSAAIRLASVTTLPSASVISKSGARSPTSLPIGIGATGTVVGGGAAGAVVAVGAAGSEVAVGCAPMLVARSRGVGGAAVVGTMVGAAGAGAVVGAGATAAA